MVGLYESMIDEAARINLKSLSDVELFTLYWDEWSGLNTGRGGLSGNAKATRIADFIYTKFDVWSHTGQQFDPTYCISTLSDFVCHEQKVSEFDRDFAPRIKARMHEMIKINIDWIAAGDYTDEKGIKIK